MPVRGRPLKDNAVTRHQPQHTYLTIPNVPYEPTKEQARCPVVNAPPETRRWWKMVSTLPHASMWEEGEWEYAKATAKVHAEFWQGRTTLGKALHDRERVIGTTEDARRALRIRYADSAMPVDEAPAKEGEAAKPVPIDRARRERLTRGEE